METPTRQHMREWTAALSLAPLDVSDPAQARRYVPLADAGRSAVDELQATIELSFGATTQLLSGPSGSGKTTELYRLRRDLRESGFDATVIDITSYLSESSTVDVTEFLIALALGAHDALAPSLPEPQRPSFTARLRQMLGRLNVELEVAGVKAALSTDSVEVEALGAKVGIDLTEELKSSKPLVDELRAKLSYHVKQLYDEVATFLQELVPPTGELDQGSVLIVDGLEKLRGTTANDQDVQRSIEALFVHHAAKLKFGSHHLVYTVPTYLQFTSPGALPYDSRPMVPVPHLRSRTGEPDPEAEQNLRELRDVIARRIPVDQIFAGSPSLLDQAIHSSGGHLRDLFRILQNLINLMARTRVELPVGREHVEEAIRALGRDFAAMTEEQARFLREVAQGDGTVRPSAADVALMAKLVQSHMLLGHVNGDDWYEVHPLARRALGLQ